jgi:bifunctional non-homologous end joining protein LigD
VLDLLPKGHVFDGELVVLDDAGRPLFNELLFGHRRPTYVAFDLLIDDGIDLRPLPLKQRKARLARLGEHAEGWIALTNGVGGEGRALFRAVVDADLEGKHCVGSPTTLAACHYYVKLRSQAGRVIRDHGPGAVTADGQI